MQQKRSERLSGEGLSGGKTVKVADRRERGHSVREERSSADVVYLFFSSQTEIADNVKVHELWVQVTRTKSILII